MSWYNILEFIMFYFHFNLSLFHALCFMSILTMYLLHYTWLRCIKSCTKDPSHRFLTSRWFIHSWFIDLGNPFKVVVHYLLIRGMTDFGHRNGVPMVSILVCIITHWIRPTVSYDIRLSSNHEIEHWNFKLKYEIS